MGTTYQENPATVPLSTAIPAYLYQEFADDPDVQAFVTAGNGLLQGYLNWFLNTPLAVWTSPGVSGPLLDWTATNIYGTTRPVISISSSSSKGALATYPTATLVTAGFVLTQSGTDQIADDDLYKRTLTWILYRGDGKQATIEWLRRRIARFLYGVNGGDIDIGLITNISIGDTGTQIIAPYGTAAYGTAYYGEIKKKTYTSGGILFITVPNLIITPAFIALFQGGFLPAPFQMTYNFTIA